MAFLSSRIEAQIVGTDPSSACGIGAWTFDPALGTLSGGGEVRRLEHRAAAVLAMLARRRGEVVSRQELLGEVWHGRTVSPNSVAIVIGDLRRALDDDPKAPALLMTVAKRGYRLAPPSSPEGDAGETAPDAIWRRRRMAGWIGGMVLLAAAMAAAAGLRNKPDPRDTVRIVASPVLNQTGVTRDGPLASALDGLVLEQLTRMPGVTVERPGAATGGVSATDALFSSKLVLWNRLPTLEMSLVDQTSHRVIWSDMAIGDADHIAAETIARLAELRRQLESQPGMYRARQPAGPRDPRAG